jgi:hypothetical protein
MTHDYTTLYNYVLLLTCRNFLRSVESYIIFEHDLADFLANVRASYDIWLREGGIDKLTHASVQKTLSGAISEVHVHVYIGKV